MSTTRDLSRPAEAPLPPPHVSSSSRSDRRRSFGLIVRAVQVRLRFIVVLLVAFVVVGRWDDFRNRWDWLTRSVGGDDAASAAVSSDTEYFCPMDPGVLSDWPGKCGVCNMGLVRRRKGEAVPLPNGVVARMQLSPYRVQLAGVQTSPASYRALAREAVVAALVIDGGDKLSRAVGSEVSERDVGLIDEGQRVEVARDPSADHFPLAGKVTKVVAARVEFEIVDADRKLRAGETVTVRVRQLVSEIEPFRSLPADCPVLRQGESRSVYLCPEHADVLRASSGRCPVDDKVALESQPLLSNQRIGWWCPMHPTVAAERPGKTCPECGGMTLAPRVVTYRPKGQVLTVPESAVIDTGSRTMVYVERMAGMFDGVEVVLGPRCGDRFPVVRGLDPGDRVASAGAFLLDAETRLNPGLAAAYFGAARGNRPAEPTHDAASRRLEIPMELRALAAEQRLCPVTGKPLGSMGPPIKLTVAGRTVLVCCEGCEGPLSKSPEKYLPKLRPGVAPASARPAGSP